MVKCTSCVGRLKQKIVSRSASGFCACDGEKWGMTMVDSTSGGYGGMTMVDSTGGGYGLSRTPQAYQH